MSEPLDHRGDRTGRDHEPLARRRLGARDRKSLGEENLALEK